jgi:hypothetical protein
MARTAFLQSSFLSGEWSDHAQGRMDSANYKQALSLCTNYYPVETGALVRRMGTNFLGTTKGGVAGRLIGVEFSVTDPYQLEFTNGYMRAFQEAGIVTGTHVTISTISTATPAKVTATGSLPGDWATGDTAIFEFTGDAYATIASRLRNWQFKITKTAATQFTLTDAVTGDSIDGTDLGGDATAGGVVRKVFEVTTPYTAGAWADLRKVQDETNLILLRGGTKPYVVTNPSGTFVIAAATLVDGPYLDVNTTTTTLTPSGTSGSITVTASSTTGINNNTGFQTTDVGRHIRLWSEPSIWLAASNYVQGDAVTWEGIAYAATRSVAAGPSSPAENVSSWAPVNDVSFWSWGRITARGSTTSITVTIVGHALRNTNATTTWRVGLFGDTLGWPTCGTYHENRLWLSGVLPNRLDGSMVGDYFTFSPSAVDGTVADNHACAEVVKAKDSQDIFWLTSQDDGLWFGTQSGEWRLRASTLDDPITPTSVQVRPMMTFGSYDAEVVEAPTTLLFIQRRQRKILEIKTEEGGGEGQHYAPNLSLAAEHMMLASAVELAWQQEPTHMLWIRMADGTLRLVPYMRNTEKFFAAWTRVDLGCDRTVESISTGPSDDGNSERLFLITNDDDGVRHVAVSADVFTADTPVWAAQFADDAVHPSGSQILALSSGDAIDGLRIFGLWPLNGMDVAVVIGGLDLGDFTVANGMVDVPFTTDFTLAFLQGLVGTNYGAFVVTVADAA